MGELAGQRRARSAAAARASAGAPPAVDPLRPRARARLCLYAAPQHAHGRGAIPAALAVRCPPLRAWPAAPWNRRGFRGSGRRFGRPRGRARQAPHVPSTWPATPRALGPAQPGVAEACSFTIALAPQAADPGAAADGGAPEAAPGWR